MRLGRLKSHVSPAEQTAAGWSAAVMHTLRKPIVLWFFIYLHNNSQNTPGSEMGVADFLGVIVINAHEFVQTQGDSERRGSLARCSPWGRKESDK